MRFLFISIIAGTLSAQQTPVPVQQSQGGHTVSEILDWIKSKLYSEEGNFSATYELARSPQVFYREDMTTSFEGYDGCTLRLRRSTALYLKSEHTYNEYRHMSDSTEWGELNLKELAYSEISIDKSEHGYVELELPLLGHTKKFDLEVTGISSSQHIKMWTFVLSIKTEDMANRLSKAFQDAAKACGAKGSVKEIY